MLVESQSSVLVLDNDLRAVGLRVGTGVRCCLRPKVDMEFRSASQADQLLMQNSCRICATAD